MAEVQLLGLFYQPESVAGALDRLRALGVTDDKMTVLSMAPYRPEMLGRPKPKGRVGRIALFGALFGVALGLFLSVGIWLLYPLHQGGQPVVPIPPTLIVLFECTMLGTMWSSFFGMLGENRFPKFRKTIYDPRITEGFIGLAVEADRSLSDNIESIFWDHGAHDIVHDQAAEKTDPKQRAFWLSVGGVLIALTVILGLFVYDIIRIPFPTNMANQESIAYLQGPRLAAPPDAVPVQGPVLIDGQPATDPVPSSPDSIQRGKVLFGYSCQVCHGPNADGKSPIAGFFNPPPADLTSPQVQQLTDQEIYLVITNGFGLMPSEAEVLGREERWDVINYIRTLKK